MSQSLTLLAKQWCPFYTIIGAAKFPPAQDVIAVSGNPAYEQVTLKSIAIQENSAYSIVHTVLPPPVDDSSHVPLCLILLMGRESQISLYNKTVHIV